MLVNNNKNLTRKHYARRFKDVFHLKVDKKTYEDHLFLGLADMDWKSPSSMIKDINKKVNEGSYNYCYCQDDLKDAISYHMKSVHDYEIECSKITIGNGVIHLIQCALHVFTKPGDGIIIQTPGYHPFFHIVESNDRKVVENRLVWDEVRNKFVMNWDELEEQFKTNKFLIWCSPHNPTGRVWTDEENKKLVALAKKHDVFIASDEIWKDIIFSPHKHKTLVEYDYSKIFMITSIGKTYNIGSLQFGYGMSNNYQIVKKIREFKDQTLHIASHNRFTVAALKSGYLNKDTIDWAREMVSVCKKNRDCFTEMLKDTDFQLSVPEGTYIYWINFEKYVDTPEQLDVLLEDINTTMSNGWSYRGGFEKWARFTFAISPYDMKRLTKKLLSIHYRSQKKGIR